MAQITNTLNSVDYQAMFQSTAISEDEDEINDHQAFLTPSLDIDLSQNVTVDQSPFHSNAITINDLPKSNTLNNPSNETYVNLSTSSSESSLARPLLPQANQRHSPTYTDTNNTENVILKAPSSPTGLGQRSSMALYMADMFISAFLITPLLNIHWRGAWDLLDLHLLPEHGRLSALVSLVFSSIILYALYLTQNSIQTFYEKYRKHFIGHTFARFYTLIIAFAYINQWRGLWNLLDYTSNHWISLLIETILSIIGLVIFKSIYNLNSAPFLTGTDREFEFLIGSKYKITRDPFLQYTFDFLFYEFVEATLVITAWRGLYNLSDLYIYPDNGVRSMIISFVIGYGLFFALAIIQISFVQCFLKRKHRWIRSFLSNLFYLLAFISVVQIWRSLWMMCEQYINITAYPTLTLWLCYIVAFVILGCTFSACSLNGPGGAKDSLIDDQLTLLFKFEYLSDLIKSRVFQSKGTNINPLISDASSTETIVTADRPDQLEPP